MNPLLLTSGRRTAPMQARALAATPSPRLRAWLTAAALALAGPAWVAPALAQTAPRLAVVPLQVSGADVDAAEALVPGAELPFTVWATPGARVTVRIDGGQQVLALSEVRAGVYAGTYVVSQRDRLVPDANVAIEARIGERAVVAALDEPLQGGWVAAATATAPQIDRFSVTVGGDGQGADALLLRVECTPGARVTVQLPGADNRRIRLAESARGVYSARYTLSAADALRPDAAATAYLRSGNQRVHAVLPRPFAGMDLRTGQLMPAPADRVLNKAGERGSPFPGRTSLTETGAPT